MKKYLILFDTYAWPPALDKRKASNKVLAVCDTLEIAKKYCEKLAKDMFDEYDQKKFDWYKYDCCGYEAYGYSETLCCGYLELKSMASYHIEEVKYIDQV